MIWSKAILQTAQTKAGPGHLWVSDEGHSSPHNTEAGLPNFQASTAHTPLPVFTPVSREHYEPCPAEKDPGATCLLRSDCLQVTSLAHNKIAVLERQCPAPTTSCFPPDQALQTPDPGFSRLLGLMPKPPSLIRLTAKLIMITGT